MLDRSTPNVYDLLGQTMSYSYFGKSQYSDTMLNGAIADAQLYTEALTDTHIYNLYSGGDATGCPLSTLNVALCPSSVTVAPSNNSNTILQLRLQGNTNDINSRTCQQQCALSKGCAGIVFTPDATNATYNCELRWELSGTGASALALIFTTSTVCTNNAVGIATYSSCPLSAGVCTIATCQAGYTLTNNTCIPPSVRDTLATKHAALLLTRVRTFAAAAATITAASPASSKPEPTTTAAADPTAFASTSTATTAIAQPAAADPAVAAETAAATPT